MGKYIVRVYINTFCDFEVDAENKNEAIEIAENKELDINQLLDNLCRGDSSDVEEIKNN